MTGHQENNLSTSAIFIFVLAGYFLKYRHNVQRSLVMNGAQINGWHNISGQK